MAALTTQQRRQVWKDLMEYFSQQGIDINVHKGVLLTVIGNTDDFQESIAASYNAALPAAARTALTAADKSYVFRAVAKAKYESQAGG